MNRAIDAAMWSGWLASGAKELGLELDDQKIGLLRQFAEELLEAGKTFNLTGISDPFEMAVKLMLDSMYPGKFIQKSAGDSVRVLDLGTGAGFPGVPIKIARPELSMHLIDSRRKRINFLKYAIGRLGLADIRTEQIRAEDLAKREGQQYDTVVCRAVSSLAELAGLAAPLLKTNGRLVAMKGDMYKAMAEVEAAGFDNAVIYPYVLSGLNIERTVIVVETGEIFAWSRKTPGNSP